MSNGHPLYDLVPPELKKTCDPYCKTFWSSPQGCSGCTAAPSRPSCDGGPTYDPCSDHLGDPLPEELDECPD